ncbi:MAG: hypothetical protein HY675_27385 [Chloroflexi bacterium]|nr:hypothetical protein [Chloroflexota bacterium]
MLILALVLLAVGVAWLMWRRPGRGELPNVPKIEVKAHLNRVGPQVDRVRKGWSFLRKDWSFFGKDWSGQRSALASRFRSWTATAEARGLAPDAHFVAWLEKRSDRELAEHVGQVASFCESSGFELAWLLDGKGQSEATLAVEKVVLAGAQAIWSATDSHPFVAYLQWQRGAGDKSTRAFEARLYGRLVEAGLANTPANLLLAGEKDRKTHVRQAIESAARSGQEFIAILSALAEEPAAVEKANPKEEKRGSASKAAAGVQAV